MKHGREHARSLGTGQFQAVPCVLREKRESRAFEGGEDEEVMMMAAVGPSDR